MSTVGNVLVANFIDSASGYDFDSAVSALLP